MRLKKSPLTMLTINTPSSLITLGLSVMLWVCASATFSTTDDPFAGKRNVSRYCRSGRLLPDSGRKRRMIGTPRSRACLSPVKAKTRSRPGSIVRYSMLIARIRSARAPSRSAGSEPKLGRLCCSALIRASTLSPIAFSSSTGGSGYSVTLAVRTCVSRMRRSGDIIEPSSVMNACFSP